jgi:hypothetical protein
MDVNKIKRFGGKLGDMPINILHIRVSSVINRQYKKYCTAKAQRSQRTAFCFLVFSPAFLCVLSVSSEAGGCLCLKLPKSSPPVVVQRKSRFIGGLVTFNGCPLFLFLIFDQLTCEPSGKGISTWCFAVSLESEFKSS